MITGPNITSLTERPKSPSRHVPRTPYALRTAKVMKETGGWWVEEILLPMMQRRCLNGISAIRAHHAKNLNPDSLPLLSMVNSIRERELPYGSYITPPFHTEMADDDAWPSHCDRSRARDLLYLSYEHNRAVEMLNKGKMKEEQPEEAVLAYRLGGEPPFPPNTSYGQYRRPMYRSVYGAEHHNFGNAPGESIVLSPGRTHVGVGFNDLGQLLLAGASFPISEGQEPARWLGIDASPTGVARTLVLIAMLRSDDPIDDIIQVGYSATWTPSAQSSFQHAVNTVLTEQEQSPSDTHAVRAALFRWKILSRPGNGIDMADARRKWMSEQSLAFLSRDMFAMFRHRRDRVALAAYFLGGDVCTPIREDSRGEHSRGSITMFGNGEDVLTDKESNFLKTVPMADLLASYYQSVGTVDIVQAGAAFLHHRLSLLGAHLRSGRIIANAECAFVSTDDPQTHLVNQADSMSWSNVVDYITEEEFHGLAVSWDRAHRRPIQHQAYSMNWVRKVFGTYLADYPPAERPALLEDAKRAHQVRLAADAGLASLLSDAPLYSDTLLLPLLNERYYHCWLEEFYRPSRSIVPVRGGSGLVLSLMCNPICSMRFTYKE